jgi:uncharacterized membrane protein
LTSRGIRPQKAFEDYYHDLNAYDLSKTELVISELETMIS